MEMIKLINRESTKFNLWKDALKETLENNQQPLKIMYQLDATRCIELWVLGLAQMSYDWGYSYVCYAQKRIVVLQQHWNKDYQEPNYQYVLEEPLVDYCTIPKLDKQDDKSRNNPLSCIKHYPNVWKVLGRKDYTEAEKAGIKSCKVVEGALGHIDVELCYNRKSKGKYVRETFPIDYHDEHRVKVNQTLNIEDLTRIVLENQAHQNKFIIKFK